MTPEETQGVFDNFCSAVCDHQHPCLEGRCLSFDGLIYWCLPKCEIDKVNTFVGQTLPQLLTPVAATLDPVG